MLIFVPMAGAGDRYARAGYAAPKPLIEVDGVPMIERVVRSFEGAGRFLFTVSRLHAERTPLLAVLRRIAPSAEVAVIEAHKDGPVRTLLDCAGSIPDDEEVVLNYCDFGVDWSFGAFRAWLARGAWDGAMTAYRGFHPHSLGPTLYAYLRHDGERVTEVREKHHFTPDRMGEYASSGLYYFRRGRDLVRLARELVASGERVPGEFYVSMVMQRLIAEGGRVGVHPLDHFYQWGTPEDLRDYEGWSRGMGRLDAFVADVRAARSRASQVIPMAGRGQRFVDRGYADPKPLIDVAGQAMIAQAVACLPTPAARVLVAQRDHAAGARFREATARLRPAPEVVALDGVTEGQACTAALGVARVDPDAPVLVAPCDTGYVYDVEAWLAQEAAGDADAVVFGARGHLPALWGPASYGWMEVDAAGRVRRVAVKETVSGVDRAEQQVVTGTFWFRDAALFARETAAMVAADDRVNGEFYVDTIARRMVAAGARVKCFTVEKYMPWGTPDELRTFEYWNDVFRGGRPMGAGPAEEGDR